MSAQYTLFPSNLPDVVQMNAGIVADGFDPATGTLGRILGATGNGITFDPKPTFEDLGADIDNVPANSWQLKRLVSYDPVASGTFRTMTAELARQLCAAGAYGIADGQPDETHIIPGHALQASDFRDVWIIGDYSNAATPGAGFIAVHLKHALNATGFKWKTFKDGKGEFEYEFHAHYDLASPDDPPFEVYVRGANT